MIYLCRMLRSLGRILRGSRDGDTGNDDDYEGRGLICLYCGAGGFEDQDALEDHLDGHPFLERRSKVAETPNEDPRGDDE